MDLFKGFGKLTKHLSSVLENEDIVVGQQTMNMRAGPLSSIIKYEPILVSGHVS